MKFAMNVQFYAYTNPEKTHFITYNAHITQSVQHDECYTEVLLLSKFNQYSHFSWYITSGLVNT